MKLSKFKKRVSTVYGTKASEQRRMHANG